MNRRAGDDLMRDTRQIVEVHFAGERLSRIVGCEGVTKIEAYGEPGHMGFRPWLAIYLGDHLAERIDADGTRVVYGRDS